MEAVQTDRKDFGFSINTDKCGSCIYCVSVCPYEAIKVIEETKKVQVDPDKCRMCGICYATCPSQIIEMKYYSIEALSEYVQKKIQETNAEEVVLACRGTGLTPNNWQEKTGIKGNGKYVFFTLPCLGRIHLQFLLNTIEAGARKISLFGCEEEFCRYKEGSKIMSNKFISAQAVFEDMGYEADMLDFKTLAPKAEIDDKKCIACGTCAFICPYEAAKIEPCTTEVAYAPKPSSSRRDVGVRMTELQRRSDAGQGSTPEPETVQGKVVHQQAAKLDKEKCKGCGLCVPSCPAIAITLENSDFDLITQEIQSFAVESIIPKILVLGCQWSEYRSGDEDAELPQGVKFIRMPCSGRTDILHILKALSSGIDGVLVSMCLDDICNLETGNKRSLSRLSKLTALLEKLGLQERVKVIPVHPKYMDMFKGELNAFIQKIKGMPKTIPVS